ncbi:cytidine/deoxycytidylate deaminase family protein [Candidatus Falkowbacteria bacterium]|nr:cytidine/deoxycytidylate deaminase family protein [Candidatus Falkowbacteria bacterium]
MDQSNQLSWEEQNQNQTNQTNEPAPAHVRPTWDQYFLNIARAAATRGTCDRGRTGCCVSRDRHILVTGYVGSPKGCLHCDEVGHEMHTVNNPDGSTSQHCIRTSHAEQNAMTQAAKLGVALDGATIYCLMFPCYTCAKMLINCGIKRVVVEKDYHAAGRSKEILKLAGVEYVLLNDEMEHYANQ